MAQVAKINGRRYSGKRSQQRDLGRYAGFIGEEKIVEIVKLGEELKGIKLQQVNSARVGGGVAEMLKSVIPIEQELGLDVSWEVIGGDNAFFAFTKTLHNFLQGRPGAVDILGTKIYWDNNRQNYNLINENADVVIIHDPQPAGLIAYVPEKVRERQKWLWRCHIQLDTELLMMMDYLRPLIELYDGNIYSASRFIPRWRVNPYVILPYIDPFSEKNRDMTASEINEVLEEHGVEDPVEKPLITIVSRFDPFKGHSVVLDAFTEVHKEICCQLLLVGGTASDDPENQIIFEELQKKTRGLPDVHLLNLPPDCHREINAFQRASSVILQPSLKEGFGLTVTEGMWKGKPVIGGNVGGIPAQIADGYNGFLITPGNKGVCELIERIMYLLKNPAMAQTIGSRARESVRERFLITRGIWDELTMIKGIVENRRQC
ncbi:MAG: glycosyltransferase [Bacillota bacterium]